MSTLKVNKLRDTAGSADAITLDPNGGAVLAGVTTVTSVKVGAAVTISESGIEASGIGITCASINGTQIGGRRNLIINGAMQVAQRGTSSTSSGYQTVDRWKTVVSGTDEAPTFAQTAVTSSDSGDNPFAKGITKTFKITNGNQTSGAGSSDRIEVQTNLESADLRDSGWNYTSPTDFITFSFYIKSSVAQKFAGRLQTQYGTAQRYKFNTPILTANTWTRVVQTIPGNSNLQFDDTADNGFRVSFFAYMGTGFTDDSATETWAANEGGNRADDMTSTWYTTNDATLEITGFQLEVGSQATAFEHRNFHEERELCRRYYHAIIGKMGSWGSAVAYSTSDAQGWYSIHPEMRAAPTFTWTGTLRLEDGAAAFNTSNTTASTTMGTHGFSWWTGGFSGLVDNNVYYVYELSQTGYFQLDAEL